VKQLRRLIGRVARDDEGITGLETAIILIAFVVVATVFAFVVLTTGIFSSERGKETVYAGLSKARGTMEVRGGVVATADMTATPSAYMDSVQLTVANTAGGDPIPLDPTGTTNRTVIAYRDATAVDNDVSYTATEILGDGDTLLEPGELFTLSVDITDVTPAVTPGANLRFTLEAQTPVGAVLDITRTLPAELKAVMQLH
jgi:flagellin FlaB